MCETHRSLEGVVVAERTPVRSMVAEAPVKTIVVSEEDKDRAALDRIIGLEMTFGKDRIRKAFEQRLKDDTNT